MHPTTRFFVRCAIAFLLIFLATQLFNRFCLFSYKCQPFYFSKYWPRTEGSESFYIDFSVINNKSDLQFDVLDARISTVTNRVNNVEFLAQNLSNKRIVFRPSLKIEPENFTKYIHRINCLCAHEYSLAPKQSAKLQMQFFIDPKMIDEEFFQEPSTSLNKSALKITYSID